jgi:hypothetical protein
VNIDWTFSATALVEVGIADIVVFPFGAGDDAAGAILKVAAFLAAEMTGLATVAVFFTAAGLTSDLAFFVTAATTGFLMGAGTTGALAGIGLDATGTALALTDAGTDAGAAGWAVADTAGTGFTAACSAAIALTITGAATGVAAAGFAAFTSVLTLSGMRIWPHPIVALHNIRDGEKGKCYCAVHHFSKKARIPANTAGCSAEITSEYTHCSASP